MINPDEPPSAESNGDEQQLPGDEQPREEPPEPQPREPAEQPHDYPDPVDESSDDSFPASDPPSYTGSTATLEPDAQ